MEPREPQEPHDGSAEALDASPGDAGSAPPLCHIQINFGSAGAPPVEGYLHDFGQAFAPRENPQQGSVHVYGWTNAATGEPLDISVGGSTPGNGRQRGTPADVRLATLMHMQGGTLLAREGWRNGTPIDASWEIALPRGWYQVTASVGDADHINSRHHLGVEAAVAVDAFVPTASERFREVTVTVHVADGRLTLDATGGFNTKLNYVSIVAVPAPRPRVTATAPTSGATGVVRDTAIVFDVYLPTAGNGVDGASLATPNIRLERTADGVSVPFTANTSAAGDVIVVQPTMVLEANTTYRVSVTQGVRDGTGASFEPFEVTFVTGTEDSRTGGDVAFEKVGLDTASGAKFTSVTIGPDLKLYASTLTGEIWRFVREANGTTGPAEIITSLVTNNASPRAVIGLAFDPASNADAPILWVTHGAPQLDAAPDWSGKVSRLSGNALEVVEDVVVGLPRSLRDHMTNSIAFGPDGALYLLQGSNSAMGDPDSNWGFRPERLLTAALLRLDPALIVTRPLDVKTEEGGTYDPFAPGAPVTLHARGIRNAYDLLFHSNGQLYVPTNGSAAPGRTPSTPSTLPPSCAQRPDGPYVGPSVVGLAGVAKAQSDFLFRVESSGYYGHPNPTRCEWVLNGGNPTDVADLAEVNQYAVGTAPDANWRGAAHDFGLHASPNGIIEFRSDVFGARLRGKLLVVRYSAGKDIIVLTPGPDGNIVSTETGIAGFTDFASPLDLTAEASTGFIYVSELGGQRIVLLRPIEGRRASVTPSDVPFGNVVKDTVSAPAAVNVRNTGGSPLTISRLLLVGDAANDYQVTAPTVPFILLPGAETLIDVRFAPTSSGPKFAQLVVQTNDPLHPSLGVALTGLGTDGLGGSLEPSLQWVLDTLRIPINVGDTDATSSALPADSLLGDEVVAPVFEKAAGGPVTVELIASFAPQGRDPAASVGWYAAGNPTARNALASLISTQAQTLHPVAEGQTTFEPESALFGFYSTWPSSNTRAVYSEDRLNPASNFISHHVRVYPYKEASGNIVPNAFVVAHEESSSGTFDYQDVVFIVRNVRPAVFSGPILGVQNLDVVPFADRLVMNRIGSLTSPPSNRVHSRSLVRLTNTGNQELAINDLVVTGPFSVEDLPTLPVVLAPGATRDLAVRFEAADNGTGNGSHVGSLSVASNDVATPTRIVQLAGFWQAVSEGGQEPDLIEVAKVFGYGTVIANSGQKLDGRGHVEAIGDEVLAPYWERADASRPVSVRQLAAFHNQGNTASVRWHPRTSTSVSNIFTHAGIDGQSFLPLRNNSTAPASGSFDPPAAFGFNIDGEWSDASRNNQGPDRNNGCKDPCGHHVRFWPLKDNFGVTMPDQYMMVMDYAGINYDYNDNMYIIENVKPAAD